MSMLLMGCGSGGGFNPLSLNPSRWYDWSNLATVYQDSARTTLAESDLDPVGGVADLSGNGSHLGQSTDATRPRIDLDGINGNPACEFGVGGARWLTTGTYSSQAQPVTYYIVFKSTRKTATESLFDGESTGGRQGLYIYLKRAHGLVTSSYIGELPELEPGVHILGITFNGTSTQYWRNGMKLPPGGGAAGSYNFNFGTGDSGGLVVGSDSAKTNFRFIGHIGELIQIPSTLTDTQHLQMSTYLSNKWGRALYTKASTGTIGSDNWYIIPPTSYTSGSFKLIYYCHGVGGTGYSFNNDTLSYTTCQALWNAGYWIIGSDLGGDNWGNQASIDALADLYDFINARDSISKNLFWPISMGGVAAFNALRDNRLNGNIQGIYGTYPVCNLADMFDGNAGTYASNIRTAYGIATDGSDYSTKTSGYDPVLEAAEDYPVSRYKFVASASDTVVDKVANTDQMRTLLGTRSPAVTQNDLRTHTGDHGDATAFDTTDIVTFFDGC